ncbi:MAG: SCO family protein [Alphaproteobacteria bacterium]|nr:SCO family protein [Alphaproteobacteria bacterium]
MADADPQRTGLGIGGAVAVGLVLVGLIAVLLRQPGAEAPPERDWRAQIAAWRHPDGLPDLPLVDERGAPFGLHALADRWVLVGFVFTRCGNQEACPLTMAQMRAVQAAWTDDLPPLHLLTVTIDPAYDTPERLAAYAERFGREADGPVPWTLATGDPELLEHGLPALFNLLVLPEDGTLTHTVKLALLKPGLVLDAEWEGHVGPAEIFARMR